MNRLKNFARWMSGFKDNKKTLVVLIVLDIFMAIGSNIVDWPAMAQVPWYLIPFAPICSLYPLALAVWFTLWYFTKRVPQWFTVFVFIGITSYGVMAQIYYPVFIYFEGLHWNLVGNMVWVAVYALQSLIIVSEVKPLKFHQYLPIFAYFLFKDFSDRYLGTFTDILFFDFSEFAKNALFVMLIFIHLSDFFLAYYVAHAQKRVSLKPLPQESPAKDS